MKYKDFDNNGYLEGLAISSYGNYDLVSISDAEYNRTATLLMLMNGGTPDVPVEFYHDNIEEVKTWY